MDIEIQDLRVLRAVAEHGSLAGAARALGVNQAGVTRRIQHLERTTGLVVLRRDHHGARLTAAGRLLLRCADDLLPRIDHLLAVGGRGSRPDPSAERLRIGAVPTPALPLVTAHGRALLPSAAIEVQVVPEVWHEPAGDARGEDFESALLDLFHAHRLDLAVVRHSCLLDGPLPERLRFAVLAEENLLLGTAAGHPLAGRPPVALTELDGETCLLVEGRRHAELRRHFTAAVRRTDVGVTLRWVPDEAAAAALTCAVHGVLPAYPYPAPAAGVVYTPLSDAATRYWLLLVWQPHSRAAAWAPRLAETVHATYQGTWMP